MGGRREEGGADSHISVPGQDRWMDATDGSEVGGGGPTGKSDSFRACVRACVRAAAAAACERAKLCARERESVPPPARAGTRQISSGTGSGTPPLQSDSSN